MNGGEKSLLVALKVVQGSTLVPLRFVSDASGRDVAWDQTTEIIHIGGKPSVEQFKPPIPTASKLKVHFIDVGQGDSLLNNCLLARRPLLMEGAQVQQIQLLAI